MNERTDICECRVAFATENIIYILEGKKCGDQYIRQTGNSLRGRFLDHLGYARREELNKSTGDHFNLPGHKMSDMEISVLEQVKEANTYYMECRESFHIEYFTLSQILFGIEQ